MSKRLKKEKVNVDIISFGEEERNAPILNELVNTINGKEGTGSHLVSIAAPASLSDALFSSPIFQGEDGNMPAGFGPGFQYGMEDDPELAMVIHKLHQLFYLYYWLFSIDWKALRISMEESRLKQEADAKKATGDKMETDANPGLITNFYLWFKIILIKYDNQNSFFFQIGSGDDDLLQQALALSLSQQDDKSGVAKMPDLSAMTEEEQLHYALQMSMAASATTSTTGTEKQTPIDAEMKDVSWFKMFNSKFCVFN